MVSFAYPDCLPVVADVCQSFALDCGAFTAWKQGKPVDLKGYYEWVREWRRHPGFDWAIIPDVIDGTEYDNMRAIGDWHQQNIDARQVPVWHLHESFDKLRAHAAGAFNGVYEAVAFGSSGQWSTPGTEDWWARIAEAMSCISDDRGRPYCRIHGLRMLNPNIVRRIPFRSADSTNAAQNNGLTSRFGSYPPPNAWQRAAVIADRIESYEVTPFWSTREIQENLFS